MSDIADLRRATNEPPEDTTYADALLEAILTAAGSLPAAAAQVWTEKAARFSQLVNMAEGDSRRDLAQLQQNALRMAELYQKQIDDPGGVHQTTIGRITRP